MSDLVERLRENDEMLRDGLKLPNLTAAWHNVVMKQAAKDSLEAADALASQATLIAELQGEDRWKDISTAPKDGTYILVHQKGVPEPSTTVCCWDEAWGIGGWWMCCDGKNPELPLRGPGPTFWHPIPALKGGLNGK